MKVFAVRCYSSENINMNVTFYFDDFSDVLEVLPQLQNYYPYVKVTTFDKEEREV